MFERKEFTAEDRITFVYDSGDFSFATCQKILNEFYGDAPKSDGARKRVLQGAVRQAAFGFYVYGGMSGVTKAVVNHTALARYLNGFIKAHVEDDATWGAISIIKGGAVKVHHDYNNAAGSSNYFASFGQETGGELRAHDDRIKENEVETDKDGSIVWKRTGAGDWLPGRLIEAREKFVKFDPHVKHQALDVGDEGWRIVAYTPRGTEDIKPDLGKFLRNCGFPLPTKRRGGGDLATGRPTKKQRNSITNVVGKLSVLFTTLLVAANSFIGECIQTEVINDPIVLLEIGGFDATLDATRAPVLGRLQRPRHEGSSTTPGEGNHPASASPTPSECSRRSLHRPQGASSRATSWRRSCSTSRRRTPGRGRGHRQLIYPLQEQSRRRRVDSAGEAWCQGARDTRRAQSSPCPCCERARRKGATAASQTRWLWHYLRQGGPWTCESRLKEAASEPRPPKRTGSIKAAKGMKCQTCDATKEPQVARPATLPRMLSFGEVVCADILYAHDCEDKRHSFLSLVDVGTTYHVVIKLRNTGGKEIEQAFNTYWLTPFGAPNAISLDLETGLQDGFSRLCSWHNVKIRNSATQAHFQSGVGERQGKWFKNIWVRVCRELSITADEVQLAATSVCSAKNSLRRRCGHSPAAWIFGRETREIEQVLDPDSGGRVTFDISEDAKFQRQMAIRASARVAFHHSENDGKLRKALLQRARATTRPFENGEQVHYWNLPKNRRQGRWEGPAIMVGREGNNYWVSRNGRCRLTAPEHLRPSGPDETGEFLAMSQMKRELEQLLEDAFASSDDEHGDGGVDDLGTLYSPSDNPEGDIDIEGAEDRGHEKSEGEPCAVDEEGDELLEPLFGQGEEDGRDREPPKRGWPTSRMKRKAPQDPSGRRRVEGQRQLPRLQRHADEATPHQARPGKETRKGTPVGQDTGAVPAKVQGSRVQAVERASAL